MTNELLVYGDSRSGNCYKIQLLCAELEQAYEWREVDILAGDTRTPEFLAMNPNGRIPLARLADGRFLAESNAILAYLAEGTPFAGEGRFGRAEVLQWMFFEQYSHEPYIATLAVHRPVLGQSAGQAGGVGGKASGRGSGSEGHGRASQWPGLHERRSVHDR